MTKNKSENNIDNYFNDIRLVLDSINKDSIIKLSDLVCECIKSNKTIFIAGNGGSASNASHICGDYLKSLYDDFNRIRIICLNDNHSFFSAVSNDYSFEQVFDQQLKRLACKGDIFIGLSGSGNSSNITKAMKYSKSKGIYTVGISAFSGGELRKISDLHVHIPIDDMEIAEDFQLIIFHFIKQSLSNKIFGKQIQGDKYLSRLKNQIK